MLRKMARLWLLQVVDPQINILHLGGMVTDLAEVSCSLYLQQLHTSPQGPGNMSAQPEAVDL